MDTEALRALVHAKVMRLCPRHVRDDVETDAVGAFWQHVQAGKRVDRMEGLVTTIVRTCLSRLRRQQRRLSYRVPEGMDDLPRRTIVEFAITGTEATASLAHIQRRLRGPMQRWLLDQAIEGVSSIMMAEMRGSPLNEVHRQLRDLAAKVREVNSRE